MSDLPLSNVITVRVDKKKIRSIVQEWAELHLTAEQLQTHQFAFIHQDGYDGLTFYFTEKSKENEENLK